MEVRRAGSRDGQELLKFMKPPELEKTLLAAAKEAQAETQNDYLNALEVASYSLARAKGTRVLVTFLDPPKFNRDGEARLQQILEQCKSKSIAVFVLELGGQAPGEGGQALDALATGSGGQWARNFEDLDKALGALVPAQVEAAAVAAKPTAAASNAPSNELQVYARLVKTAPIQIAKISAKLGPMTGLLILEVPMRSLAFKSSGGSYEAKARLTANIKDANGTVVWTGTKDYSVKGPAAKLEPRKAGAMYYVRELQLPAAKYALEAKVEDLIAEKSAVVNGEAEGANSLPGLGASDLMFVRKFDRSVDAMQGDSVISYEGEGLAPMLSPAFAANEPFQLELFFTFFPDMNGKQPVLTLDILSKGQSNGITTLAFTDKLRDDSRSGSGSAFAGEQKGKFPYLARIGNASFNEGEYEAVIEVKQDSVSQKRAAHFRVYRK
ncbi:hypothetical protein [Paludibaculum fermentans]|uniref:VWA domain-containing protein n=1 Tax=Paludibaculum fermentans TaxID=1473598 RepID=A0A7S7SN76_PALFE|nr:hypothetical protein [Paludibaculum fermentans]QOY89800.1 hypothetical protein IRI77_07570 [Paludibaculum fermentans]